MSKSLVTKTWLGGLVAIVLGVLIAGFAVTTMLTTGGTWHPAATGNGYDFVPARDGIFWTSVVGIVMGGLLALVGSVVQLVAWIGAVINTYALADKSWFIVLLIGGLFGLVFGLAGLAVMVAYMVAGPDGTVERKPEPPATIAGPARLAAAG
ncbi:MAG TPA: hypothetical protein VFL29_01385 [Candidatus Dormibacteraeota bacterium]|nr:hypothetical protein [Candidatus Dormibacteraeota bacterium]